jgi:putative transposase
MICKILQIPRSRYYRKRRKGEEEKTKDKTPTLREKENERILEIINELRIAHPFWGYRRITAFIKRKKQFPISYNRIYRIMKTNGLLVDIKRYKTKRTPQHSKPKPEKINQWWGTDMTKFYVNSVGWLYLVVVLDWYSKKILGYKLNIRSKADDWIDALEMAVEENCPLGAREYELNLMSDNGSQPTSIKYQSTVDMLKINHVTTSYSNPKGNADTERFMRTLKEEVVYPNEFDSFEEAKRSVDDFVKFYNEDYPHSSLNYFSPIDFINNLNYKNVA